MVCIFWKPNFCSLEINERNSLKFFSSSKTDDYFYCIEQIWKSVEVPVILCGCASDEADDQVGSVPQIPDSRHDKIQPGNSGLWSILLRWLSEIYIFPVVCQFCKELALF
jgi:hypothetical protein